MAQQTYIVKPGDSLSKIAKALLGDANRWKEIFEANKDTIQDPNLIHPGQELRIPGQGPVTASQAAGADAPKAAEAIAERKERDAAEDAFAALTGKSKEGPRRSGLQDER